MGRTSEQEPTREITAETLRQAYDDLFEANTGQWKGRDIETVTYPEWKMRGSIMQTLSLLDRPYDPVTDDSIHNVPGFTVERTIISTGPTSYEVGQRRYYSEGITHDLDFDIVDGEPGAVHDDFTDLNGQYKGQEHRELNPDEVRQLHERFTSPHLVLSTKPQAVPQ